MKTVALAVFVVLLFASPAFGDEVDEGLSNMATTELKANTRQMIRAGIDTDDAIRMTRAMLGSRFRQEQTLKAQEIVMRACKEGLPVEPIMNKAHEGMAKRAQHENIIRAMEKVMSRYAFGYQQACKLTQKEAQKERIMEQVAECVTAGMTDFDVDRLVYQLKYRGQAMPKDEAVGLAIETFRAAKDITRLHVHSMKASDLALEALKHHYGMREMASMRQSFMMHARDTSANTVAEAYLEAITQDNRLEGLDFSGGGTGSSVGSGHGSKGKGNGSSHGGGGANRGSGRGSGGSRGGRR
ncbi:MAG: hypothetical protein JRJ15_05810 [Deltaproteobacteria bacterium]|nr:hypothetical protein [Deltaproteobacteria bacterium]